MSRVKIVTSSPLKKRYPALVLVKRNQHPKHLTQVVCCF
ncbi:hypothetical protein M23134_02934 [Microscilla marina ATCC 23134]|uniref:Uncharacterized protein n=1 Tax=Microscilla marina ATCC 23134 TaxID=313606 RepID=A1ZSD5_MICM2|nr:hypothetical protein M23134_02934 [Microscilla marina ATCC 23134]